MESVEYEDQIKKTLSAGGWQKSCKVLYICQTFILVWAYPEEVTSRYYDVAFIIPISIF